MGRAIRLLACCTLTGLSLYPVATALGGEGSTAPSSPASAASRERPSATKKRPVVRMQNPPLDQSPGNRQDASPDGPPSSSPHQVPLDDKELLKAAREAYHRGQYDEAEAMAREAQALERQRGGLGRMFARDSASKILKDVAKARTHSATDARRAQAAQAQFETQAGRTPSQPAGGYAGYTRWRRDEAAAPPSDASLAQQYTRPAADKQAAQQLLAHARALLQQGRYSEASQAALQAKSLPVQYAAGETTPEQVFREISAAKQRDSGYPPLVDPLSVSTPFVAANVPEGQPSATPSEPASETAAAPASASNADQAPAAARQAASEQPERMRAADPGAAPVNQENLSGTAHKSGGTDAGPLSGDHAAASFASAQSQAGTAQGAGDALPADGRAAALASQGSARSSLDSEAATVDSSAPAGGSTAAPLEQAAHSAAEGSSRGPSEVAGSEAGDSADRDQLCQQWTQQARRHLALGQIREARRLANQARGLRSRRWVPFGDSPQAVLEDMVDYEKIEHDSRLKGSQKDVAKRLYEWQMVQARRLKEQGDYDLAEQLAREAAASGVQPRFGSGLTPSRLLAQIAQERAQKTETPSPVPARADAHLLASGSGVSNPGGSASPPVQAASTSDEDRAGNDEETASAQEPAEDAEPPAAAAAPLRPSADSGQRGSAATHESSAGDAALRPPSLAERMAGTTHENELPKVLRRGPVSSGHHARTVRPIELPSRLSADEPSAPADEPLREPSQPVAFQDEADAQLLPDASHPHTHAREIAIASADESDPYRLYDLGMLAMRRGDRRTASDCFQRALAFGDQLDPQTKQRMQDYLAAWYGQPVRQASARQETTAAPARQQDRLSEAQRTEQLQLKKLASDAIQTMTEAESLKAEQPEEALTRLNAVKARLEEAGKGHPQLAALRRRVDTQIASIEAYQEQHASELRLRKSNRETQDRVKREQQHRLAVQEEVARLVDEFNQLIDQGRYAEAKRLAERAQELDPTNPVTENLLWKADFAWNLSRAQDLQREKADSFLKQTEEAERAGIANVGDNPITYGDLKRWEELTNRRKGAETAHSTRTEREREIERSLTQKVTLKFKGRPLAEVLEVLSAQTGVNIVLDREALTQENVDSSTPVEIDVDGIMLKSALDLLLQPLRLKWIIRDEVLRITNEARGRGEVIQKIYHVGDLVMPVPNFGNGNQSYAAVFNFAMLRGNSSALGSPIASTSPVAVAQQGNPAQVAAGVLAQVAGNTTPAAGFTAAANQQTDMGGIGPLQGLAPGSGGAAAADFDDLIELITETIDPDSWDAAGGSGTIKEFPLNLSLIISNTQDVHDRIASLLEQLRRMLDLQIAVEVRFVTVNDDFFERIGIDFDFDIDDDQDKKKQVFGRAVDDDDTLNTFATPPPFARDAATNFQARDMRDRDHLNGVTVGQSGPGIFSSDLDIPFRQGSFELGIPEFGGFVPTAGATIGLAILSDIEAFFFINAAQGDRRTNIVQAPKVVFFNGQVGTVFDFVNDPFIIAVIPIVGAGAVAFQPLPAFLPTGVALTVSGIISADRRYVRLNVQPLFIQLLKINEFPLQLGAVGGGGGFGGGGGQSATVSPVLRLPTFAFTQVYTVVNVPDGGTVLLGGVKRVREGRSEFGVPFLNKLPYINRLFKNVGTGRETQSLMLMVTPRIIIGEEEEELLGVSL